MRKNTKTRDQTFSQCIFNYSNINRLTFFCTKEIVRYISKQETYYIPPDSDPIVTCFGISDDFDEGVATLGSPLYWLVVQGEKGLFGVVADGRGVALPPLDCLDNDVRPLDGALTKWLVVVDVVDRGVVGVAVEGVRAPPHKLANDAIPGATKGE